MVLPPQGRESLNRLIIRGVEVVSSDRILRNIANVDQTLIPLTDSTYDLGTSTLRWTNVYAVNVVVGDICFEELSCPVCNQPFKVNDSVVLKVRKVDSDKILCVPVHESCKNHQGEGDDVK